MSIRLRGKLPELSQLAGPFSILLFNVERLRAWEEISSGLASTVQGINNDLAFDFALKGALCEGAKIFGKLLFISFFCQGDRRLYAPYKKSGTLKKPRSQVSLYKFLLMFRRPFRRACRPLRRRSNRRGRRVSSASLRRGRRSPPVFRPQGCPAFSRGLSRRRR